MLSAHSQPSPTWVKTIALKGRILLLSIFLSLSMGLGRVKQADAHTAGVMKSTHQSKLKSSVSAETQSSQRISNDAKSRARKTVHVELNVVSTKSEDRKSFQNFENVVVASASASHGTGSGSGSGSSAPAISLSQPTVREVTSSQEKVPKKRRRGSVVLKEEATKEVKQSLYGLADSMKGKYVRTYTTKKICMHSKPLHTGDQPLSTAYNVWL